MTDIEEKFSLSEVIPDTLRQFMGWCPNSRVFGEKRCLDGTRYPVPVSGAKAKPPSARLHGKSGDEMYRHTQASIVFITALLVGFLGTLLEILTYGHPGIQAITVLAFLAITSILLTSTTLTVIVTGTLMKVYFGPLPIRIRTIPLSEIISARVEEDARHTIKKAVWYLAPGGEFPIRKGIVVEQRCGKTFWIGTDEPELLIKAISSAQEGSDVHT